MHCSRCARCIHRLLSVSRLSYFCIFFFFNDTATTETYTLSLHDALPILGVACRRPDDPAVAARGRQAFKRRQRRRRRRGELRYRKSTRLNSSHSQISYAVFCLKKKKIKQQPRKSSYAQTTTYSPKQSYHQ